MNFRIILIALIVLPAVYLIGKAVLGPDNSFSLKPGDGLGIEAPR